MQFPHGNRAGDRALTGHPDPADFRAAASRFLTGVAVVTSQDADGSVAAATVNSFTTVSAKPPTVLVSLMRGQTWRAITASGIYVVNVMHAEDASICNHFGGRPTADWKPYFADRDGYPILPRAIARFACDVVHAFDVTDHTLFVGAVRHCEHNDGSPLAFYKSRFRNGPGAAIDTSDGPAFPAEGWAI